MRVTPLDGGAVRRPAGPWTPWVHALLRRLAAAGFDAAPRPVSLDDGFEVVTWIDGVVGERPLSADVRSESALVSVASLLRRFHAATGGAVCHNDVGPWNVVFDGRRAVGLIDWDEASAGPALDDVAGAVWHFAPLYDDAECLRIGWPSVPDRLGRARSFCDAYGIACDGALWDAVERRMHWYRAQVEAGRTEAWRKVDAELVERDLAFLSAWIAEVPPAE